MSMDPPSCASSSSPPPPPPTGAPSQVAGSSLPPVGTPSQATSTPAPPLPRALAPDLARGFMLLLIAIANVSWHLWGHPTGLTSAHPTDGGPLDSALAAVSLIFIDVRIYPMFAFLFGYGMVQFARSRESRGIPRRIVDRMLLRRHLWLLVFGFVHALLLFNGDILGAYGLTGLILGAALFRRSDRALRITAWIFAGVILLFALGSIVLGLLMLLLPAEVQDEIARSMAASGSAADMFAGQSNYALAALIRAGTWFTTTIGTVLMLTIPLSVVLGWMAARRGLLDDPAAHRTVLMRIAGWGITIGALGGLPSALEFLGLLSLPATSPWMLMGIDTLTGVAGGAGYAALFGLLALRIGSRPGRVTSAVAGVGRRSLSFYLLQSLLFAPLLNAWGFGLGHGMGTAVAFAIAVAVWAVSLVLAAILDSRNARGPAETLLRRLTYGPHDPAH